MSSSVPRAGPSNVSTLAFQEIPMQRLLTLASALFLLGLTSCGGPSGPNPVVIMETSMGTVKIELLQDKAPNTVANFLKYVESKHYDGTIFHRVIPDFMVQGGGFLPGMKGEKPALSPIRNEASNSARNLRGTLAMARTGDPHSATAQFFINVKDNDFLDRSNAKDGWGYAVFGKVIEGMSVVDQIRFVKTTDVGGHEAVPVEDVLIKSIRKAE
jgi:peptidyl-prolyl cis-trans isomerase A (cyclophilin A)